MLIDSAAPHVRQNVDQYGRRYLVGPELAGGDAPSDQWLGRVLAGQGSNIDVVAVHYYGDPAGTQSYVQGLAGRVGGNWPWDIWLTESGPVGCNNAGNDRNPARCTGSYNMYLRSDVQYAHLTGVMQAMQQSSGSRWSKTFYWHSHVQVIGYNNGDAYGILDSARQNHVVSRPAFTEYAAIAAGQPNLSGDAYGYDQNVPVTVTPPVPGPTYYYVWEYQWCYNGNAAGDCDRRWHSYADGPMSTISPYVYASDIYVYVRVTQYTWQGGPQLGSAGPWTITGDGTCTDPSGCPFNMYSRTNPGTTDTTKAHHGTTKDPSAERLKGIGHAGNR